MKGPPRACILKPQWSAAGAILKALRDLLSSIRDGNAHACGPPHRACQSAAGCNIWSWCPDIRYQPDCNAKTCLLKREDSRGEKGGQVQSKGVVVPWTSGKIAKDYRVDLGEEGRRESFVPSLTEDCFISLTSCAASLPAVDESIEVVTLKTSIGNDCDMVRQ